MWLVVSSSRTQEAIDPGWLCQYLAGVHGTGYHRHQ
jgi:hypothetical protein